MSAHSVLEEQKSKIANLVEDWKACDLTEEDPAQNQKIIDLLKALDPSILPSLFVRNVLPTEGQTPSYSGLSVTSGGASGRLTFTEKDVEQCQNENVPYIFAHPDPGPEFDAILKGAAGVITNAGKSSHAVRQSMINGVPCVYGLTNEIKGKTLAVDGVYYSGSDSVAFDYRGNFYPQPVTEIMPPLDSETAKILREAAEAFHNTNFPSVSANVHNLDDIVYAVQQLGVKKLVWLTEYMFENPETQQALALVFAESKQKQSWKLEQEGRLALAQTYQTALENNDFSELSPHCEHVLTVLVDNFTAALTVMAENNVDSTIRLFDPAVNEVIPQTTKGKQSLKTALRQQDWSSVLSPFVLKTLECLRVAHWGFSDKALNNRFFKDPNPDMGIRGYRIYAAYPEVYALQSVALLYALKQVRNQYPDFSPTLMFPMIAKPEELKDGADFLAGVADSMGIKDCYRVACMLETPAAFTPDFIRKTASIVKEGGYSEGTNDGAAFCYADSRTGSYTAIQKSRGTFPSDQEGLLPDALKYLMGVALETIKELDANIPVGICGSHGADSRNLEALLGLNYVSVPGPSVDSLRLVMAQRSIEETERTQEQQLTQLSRQNPRQS